MKLSHYIYIGSFTTAIWNFPMFKEILHHLVVPIYIDINITACRFIR